MPTPELADQWLSKTFVYGLAWVFLFVVCAILLWGAWRVLRIAISLLEDLRIWVPTWFKAGVDTQKALVKSSDIQTETLVGMRTKSDRAHEGTKHLVNAATALAEKHRDKVPSDVIIHLTNARKILESE